MASNVWACSRNADSRWAKPRAKSCTSLLGANSGNLTVLAGSDGNLSATGAKLQATDINLSASKGILLQAATNTAEVHNKNDPSNASASATFGFGQQNGISLRLASAKARAWPMAVKPPTTTP